MYIGYSSETERFIIQIAGLDTVSNPPTAAQIRFFVYAGVPDQGEILPASDIPDAIANRAIAALYPSPATPILLAIAGGVLLLGLTVAIYPTR